MKKVQSVTFKWACDIDVIYQPSGHGNGTIKKMLLKHDITGKQEAEHWLKMAQDAMSPNGGASFGSPHDTELDASCSPGIIDGYVSVVIRGSDVTDMSFVDFPGASPRQRI